MLSALIISLTMAVARDMSAEETVSVIQLVRQSSDLAASNHLDEALSLAQRAVDADPAYADGWRQLGSVRLLLKNYTEAAEALQKAVSLSPQDGAAWRDLGWALWCTHKHAEALQAFDRAVMLSSGAKRDQLITQVVAALSEAGETRQAVEQWKRWRADTGLLQTALDLVAMGRIRAAEPLLAAAWDAGEDPAMTGLYLALTRAWNNDFSGALAYLDPFIEKVLPQATESQMNVFFECLRLCSRSPRFRDVAERLLTALVTRPEYNRRLADVLEWAGLARRAEGELPDALHFFETASNLAHESPVWLRAYILKSQLQGRDVALAFTSNLLTRVESQAVREGLEGVIADAQGDLTAAVEHYRRSLAADPAQPEIRVALFRAYLRLGRLEDARSEALALQQRVAGPEPQFRSELAEMWDALRETRAALAEWQTLALTSPDVPYYSIQVADAFFKLGEPERAIATLTNLIAINPAPAAFEWLATIEGACGRPEAAAAWAEQGLRHKRTQGLLRCLAENLESAGVGHTNALAAALEFLEKDPGYVPMALLAGRTLLQLERFHDALVYYQQLLHRSPSFLPGLVAAREAATKAGQKSRAVRYARAALRYYPSSLEMQRRCAVSLAEAGDFRTALQILRKIGRLDRRAATPILVYQNVVDGPYPGLNTVGQVVSHIERLGQEGYEFVTPGQLTVLSSNAQPRVMIIFVNLDKTALEKIDPALAEINGRAVYAGNAAILSRSVAGKPTPVELANLVASGRWFLASSGPEDIPRVPVNADGYLGNPLTHALYQGGKLETDVAFSNRVAAILRHCAHTLNTSSPRLLVYPSGDGGQLSLDTTPMHVALLRNITARNFDYAVTADDAGFYVPDRRLPYDVPGRMVPPQWSADEVVAHLKKGNPVTRAAQDLAKILYWQGQHDAADVWFAKCLAAGGDPADITFNWGNNAYLQGDLPTALEKLREAQTLAPESKQVKSALERVSDRWKPEAQLIFRQWDDNEDRSYQESVVRAELPVAASWRMGVAMGQDRWKQEQLGAEEGLRPSVNTRWYFYRGMWVDVQAWRLMMEDLPDHWGGTINVHLSNPLLSGHAELEARRSEEESVEALRADIYADCYTVKTYSRLLDMWDLYANYSLTQRTDEHNTSAFDARLVRRLNEWPFVGVGYLLRLADSDFDPPEYWAPEQLRQHQAYATLRGSFRNANGSLSAQWGYAREVDTDWEIVWGCRAGGEFVLRHNLRLLGDITYFEGPVYNRLTWMAGLGIRF